MKRKQPQINIYLNSENTNAEELKKLYDILSPKNVRQETRKKNELYIAREDIERLHDCYEKLFKQVKDNQYLTPAQIDKECETLSQKYDFEIEELSKEREKEYLEKQAKLDVDNELQIPWRRGWWWRLIFQPTTNRAQDIIERRAELEAEEKFAPMEKELDKLADKLYAGTGKKLSRRERQQTMKKYLKYRNKLIADTVQSKTLTTQTLQVNSSTTAPGASDATHQSDNATETSTGNVAESPLPAPSATDELEPPEPPTRKPRKMKQTRV